MGGDFGPRVVVAALVTSLRKHPSVSALLFGDQHKLDAALSDCTDKALLSRIKTQHCDAVITDDDDIAVVIRSKRDSSMGLAVKAVADSEADACISAGHTGALMALGMVILKTLPGISRPAICTTFPTSQGRSYMLDLGANLDCSAAQLSQFALLGSLTMQELDNITTPRVRLLNVGEEPSKGSGVIKQAADLLRDEPLINYCGYVEGDGLFEGDTDVVVCDGFSGNVALKTSEGVARMINAMLKDLLASSWLTRLAGLLMLASLKLFKARLNPSEHNGAYLLGLNGVVIKSHGGADEVAFGHALDVAIEAAKHNLPDVFSPILQGKIDRNQTK